MASVRVLLALLLGSSVLSLAPPAAAQVVHYTGVTVRQSSTAGVTVASVDHTLRPELRLISVMANWKALEPQDDAFDFAQLDLNVQHAASNGYRLIIRVMAGRRVPSWLLTSGAQTLQVFATDPNAVDYCNLIDVVTPWDPILEGEYRELMAALGSWLAQADGSGSTKGDHVHLVPIAMPTLLGSEMQIGFGASVTCPPGTDGAGQTLSNANAARWHTVGTTAQLRDWTEAAWRRAIAIHMQVLPDNVKSVIAYGGLFGDAHAAALRIAQTEIGPNRDRLWSMFTNLQPLLSGGAVAGVWKDWCPNCHNVLWEALRNGGQVGFQLASTASMDTHEAVVAAVDDALARYAPRFIETNAMVLERERDYLLTGPDPVQGRLAAIAGKVLSTTSLSCTSTTAGEPTTCTATVNELWDDPSIVPSGTVTFDAASVAGSHSCSLSGGECSVSITPPESGTLTVSASYAGDLAHLPSSAAGSVLVAARPSATSVSCVPATVSVGSTATCTATVSDQGAATGALTPTGSVWWTSGGSGVFTTSPCTLQGTGPAASCSVTYVPSQGGSHAIGAAYGGGPAHLGSDGGASITVSTTDQEPPTVRITFPADGATVARGKAITITATAADNVGVARVEFSISSSLRCTDSSAPYTCKWTVPRKAGVTYVIAATAVDLSENRASTSVTVVAR